MIINTKTDSCHLYLQRIITMLIVALIVHMVYPKCLIFLSFYCGCEVGGEREGIQKNTVLIDFFLYFGGLMAL